MDSPNTSRDRQSGSQAEPDFEPEQLPQGEEASRTGVDPPPPPTRPKRKYTRMAKPRLQEPTPSHDGNGQLLEPASTQQASQVNPADDWDLDSLRVSQDYADGLGVEQAVTDVPVSKPTKSQWVRTHSDKKFRIETLLLEL